MREERGRKRKTNTVADVDLLNSLFLLSHPSRTRVKVSTHVFAPTVTVVFLLLIRLPRSRCIDTTSSATRFSATVPSWLCNGRLRTVLVVFNMPMMRVLGIETGISRGFSSLQNSSRCARITLRGRKLRDSVLHLMVKVFSALGTWSDITVVLDALWPVDVALYVVDTPITWDVMFRRIRAWLCVGTVVLVLLA